MNLETMLNRILGRLKPLFIVLFLPAVAHAYLPTVPSSENQDLFGLLGSAQDWTWDGKLRLQADMAIEQKPSAVEGQLPTELGSVEFANLWRNDKQPFEVGLAGHVGPERDSTTKEPIFAWDEARFTWTQPTSVSFGLLYDPIVAFDTLAWGETSLGHDFKSGIDRWGMIPASDLGLQVSQASSFGDWTLQITNGEGWPNSELGVHKDYELVWTGAFPGDSKLWQAQLFYRYGQYDQLPDDTGGKQRYGGQIAYMGPSWNVGLFGMGGSDPVDGVTGVEGDRVDLSAKGGQRVSSQLAEFWARYIWGDSPHKWRALLRSGELKPDSADATKNVESLVMGLGRDLGSGLQADLLYESEDFGSTHGGLEHQRWFLAIVWGVERIPPKTAL